MLSVTVTAIPTSPFEELGNKAGWKEMHEDPTGKLPADLLQCRQGESRACSGAPKLSFFPSWMQSRWKDSFSLDTWKS